MLPANLEAILFDAGGTLVRIDYAYLCAAADAIGYTVSERALLNGEAAARRAIDACGDRLHRPEETDGSRVPEYFANLLRGAGLPEPAVDALRAAVMAHHRESNLWRVPLEGAFETLENLVDRGVRMAVVSNSDGRVRAKLTGLGLADYFEFIIDSHEEGVEKPAAEIFRRALERMGVPPERAAYIGDIYSIDTVGARSAGMHPILIDPTGAYRLSDCPTIGTLPELLRELGRDGSGRARNPAVRIEKGTA